MALISNRHRAPASAVLPDLRPPQHIPGRIHVVTLALQDLVPCARLGSHAHMYATYTLAGRQRVLACCNHKASTPPRPLKGLFATSQVLRASRLRAHCLRQCVGSHTPSCVCASNAHARHNPRVRLAGAHTPLQHGTLGVGGRHPLLVFTLAKPSSCAQGIRSWVHPLVAGSRSVAPATLARSA